MSEPTIEEMLFWLATSFQEMSAKKQLDGVHNWEAIRAILEQHRALEKHYQQLERVDSLMKESRIETIRAFVERVEKRVYGDPYLFERGRWQQGMQDELAAMEKENAGTNDTQTA